VNLLLLPLALLITAFFTYLGMRANAKWHKVNPSADDSARDNGLAWFYLAFASLIITFGIIYQLGFK
jgi:hypothetical protein